MHITGVMNSSASLNFVAIIVHCPPPFPFSLESISAKFVCFNTLLVPQEEDFMLDSKHLTIASPPSDKFTLEIVTEIYPQNNTSLEVKYSFLMLRISV